LLRQASIQPGSLLFLGYRYLSNLHRQILVAFHARPICPVAETVFFHCGSLLFLLEVKKGKDLWQLRLGSFPRILFGSSPFEPFLPDFLGIAAGEKTSVE